MDSGWQDGSAEKEVLTPFSVSRSRIPFFGPLPFSGPQNGTRREARQDASHQAFQSTLSSRWYTSSMSPTPLTVRSRPALR
jgi:hypothetical protein